MTTLGQRIAWVSEMVSASFGGECAQEAQTNFSQERLSLAKNGFQVCNGGCKAEGELAGNVDRAA